MRKRLRIKIIRWIIAQFELYLFERKSSLFYREMFKNKILTVVDVGANRGQTINFFLKSNPNSSLFSFEPNPKLSKDLKEKYKNYENVEIIQFGVSNKIGNRIFYENILDESSTFEELNMDSKYLKMKASILGVKPEKIVKKSYPVKVTTLDHFFKERNLEIVNVLKIDTEGHELKCLEGLFESAPCQDIKIIQFEMHFDDMYIKNKSYEDIKTLLNKNNYFEIKKIKHGFGNFYEYFYSKKLF